MPTDLELYTTYFIWGAVGSLVVTWFIRLNEKSEHVEQKYKLVSFASIRTILFVVWTNFVMAMIGGLTAVVFNHNPGIAIVSGGFSQFILLGLVKWLRTRDFSIALGELAGMALKKFNIETTDKKEVEDEKNK